MSINNFFLVVMIILGTGICLPSVSAAADSSGSSFRLLHLDSDFGKAKGSVRFSSLEFAGGPAKFIQTEYSSDLSWDGQALSVTRPDSFFSFKNNFLNLDTSWTVQDLSLSLEGPVVALSAPKGEITLSPGQPYLIHGLSARCQTGMPNLDTGLKGMIGACIEQTQASADLLSLPASTDKRVALVLDAFFPGIKDIRGGQDLKRLNLLITAGDYKMSAYFHVLISVRVNVTGTIVLVPAGDGKGSVLRIRIAKAVTAGMIPIGVKDRLLKALMSAHVPMEGDTIVLRIP